MRLILFYASYHLHHHSAQHQIIPTNEHQGDKAKGEIDVTCCCNTTFKSAASNFLVKLPSASMRFLTAGPVDHVVFPVGRAFAFVENLINVHLFGLVHEDPTLLAKLVKIAYNQHGIIPLHWPHWQPTSYFCKPWHWGSHSIACLSFFLYSVGRYTSCSKSEYC